MACLGLEPVLALEKMKSLPLTARLGGQVVG